jgi:ferredoxin
MIVGERKPFEEIAELLEGCGKVLIVGCGTCVKVCFAGGDKEAAQLASQLKIAADVKGKKIFVSDTTVERQCEGEFVDALAPLVAEYDVIMSMACGAGVQFLAERFTGKVVLPAVNTTHLGVLQEQGVFAEKCLGCGDCVLGRFGGVCPVTRCSKSIFNGPCGGSQNGKCEIDQSVDCGWQLIIDRLTLLGRLGDLRKVEPPKKWSTGHYGGPRKTVLEDHKVS